MSATNRDDYVILSGRMHDAMKPFRRTQKKLAGSMRRNRKKQLLHVLKSVYARLP